MKVSKLKKPFYLGAIALFATTALAVAHPITSHADSNPSKDDIAALFGLQKDQYGLTERDYNHFDRDAFAKSTLPQDMKNRFIGLSDGLNNITLDKNNKTNAYLTGYLSGQMMAQGWLHYVKHGDSLNTLPYLKSNTNRTDPVDTGILSTYYGYKDGLNAFWHDNDNYQDYTPDSNNLDSQVYNFAYKKAYDDSMKYNTSDTNKIPDISNYLHNSTPYGLSQTDTVSINYLKQFMNSDDIFGGGSVSDTPTNLIHLSLAGGGFLNNKNESLNTPDPAETSDSDSQNTNNTSNTNSAVSTVVAKPSTATHKEKAVKKVIKKHKTTKKRVAKKKVVKKHVKKTTKKHSKKRVIVKKHVSKKQVKKIRTHIPHTVYAKHRTGVHSIPQFNHGKTYFVAKGHKFHVYYKISDGHGNWRYNVGKHKFITTIPGSISSKYVKKHVTHHKHHVIKHVLHKHHRR